MEFGPGDGGILSLGVGVRSGVVGLAALCSETRQSDPGGESNVHPALSRQSVTYVLQVV